jgi:hypothetical protein
MESGLSRRRNVGVSARLVGGVVTAARAVGIDPERLDDLEARIPVEIEEALWDEMARLSGDPFFGLHAQQHLPAGHGDVLDYAVRSSPTLADAFVSLLNRHHYRHQAGRLSSPLSPLAQVSLRRHLLGRRRRDQLGPVDQRLKPHDQCLPRSGGCQQNTRVCPRANAGRSSPASPRRHAALGAFRLRERAAGSSETRTRVPVASANRWSVDSVGFAAPLSKRAIVDCDVPIRSATSAWDRCALVLAAMSMLASANSGSRAS